MLKTKKIMKLVLSSRRKCLLDFVKRKHGDQARKYTGEPYWHHVVSVAETLQEEGYDTLIETALCHDLLEDTSCSEPELLNELISLGYDGIEACDILIQVIHLTDVYTKENFPTLNRKERKKLEARRLGRISSDIQTVKLADLLDNTKSITEHDLKFSKVYLKEKREILEQMNIGDSDLYDRCVAIAFKNKEK